VKAVVVTKFGAPDVLKFKEVPDPVISAEEVLIRVKAIGLNFADIMARLGVYPSIPKPPLIPGIEVAGIVEKKGARVRNFRPGDRVVAFTQLGGYAELAKTPARNVRKIPRAMSFGDAASLMVTSLTAYHGLCTLANVRRGEKVLIHAGGGGVGTIAIQMAKLLGLEVIATASSEQKLQLMKQLGADHVINYVRDDFERETRACTGGYGVDVVFDSVGGSIIRKGMRLLAPMGRYILFGFASVAGERTINKLKALREIIAAPLLYPPAMVTKNIGILGFNLYFLSEKEEYLRDAVDQIWKWYRSKKIVPIIGGTFSFDQIVEAHTHLQSRKSYGKIVVNVP